MTKRRAQTHAEGLPQGVGNERAAFADALPVALARPSWLSWPAVVDTIPIAERAALEGETLVVVGARNESSTFPYGFFQAWKLNSNTGRFERFARQ